MWTVKLSALLYAAVLLSCCMDHASSFAPYKSTKPSLGITTLKESQAPSLTEPEARVCGLLEDLHTSKFPFRIVVVGNGAILESTNILGPKMKFSQSPATGANLVTFAAEDASFEFHLQTAQVSKIAMVEKESPVTGKTMRILRFLNAEGKSICSLILTDSSSEAAEWYGGIVEKYGSEMQL